MYATRYDEQITQVMAEIRAKQIIAGLIFSDFKACQRKAMAAIRRIEKLRERLQALEALRDMQDDNAPF